MYTIHLDKTIQQFINIFYRIGIWQRNEESNYRKIGMKCFYTLFGALFPIFLASNAFLCDDRNEAIFSAQVVVTSAVVYMKLLYLIFKQQKILEFLNDPIVAHSIENRDDYEQVNRKIKKIIKFVRPYCLGIFITGILLIVITMPMFSTDKRLPMFFSFSWNQSEIIFWTAYLFISLSVMLYTLVCLISGPLWYILLNYSMEYLLLGNRLKLLGTIPIENQGKNPKRIRKHAMNRKKKTSTSVQQSNKYVGNLINLVRAHRSLTETVERFRSCFSTLFMAQITTSGIIICVAVYMLAYASTENIVQTEFYFTVLLYALFDIFFVMHLSNEITVASDRLSYSLFESNWIEQTESCKKYVIIIGEVLKQPQQLVVLIYPLSLETFMRVVKGAYSMFNILKSF